MIIRLLVSAVIVFASLGVCVAQLPSSTNVELQKSNEAVSFAIVKVKLSPDSEADDWGIGARGRNFWAVHVTMNELIGWAYGLSARQIDHSPEWFGTERFDVDGLPETGIQPTGDDLRTMLKTALAERFGLKFHASEKVLPVYVLSVAAGGVKAQKADDSNAKSNWGVHRGWLSIKNMTFDSVAKVMQRTVFDRPVLDETGLKDRYSFLLKWRADETQFSQLQGVDVPEEEGTADVDDLYTSARKQLGIKIETAKKLAPTIVIDSVSQPTAN